MSDAEKLEEFLKTNSYFSTGDFIAYVSETSGDSSDRNAFRLLVELQKTGKIMKIRRGYYAAETVKAAYQYHQSERMTGIAAMIQQNFPRTDFQVWELKQWNEFISCQFTENIYFVETDSENTETVFEYFKETIPHVLFNPDYELYKRYRSDEMVVIQKLISGSPAADRSTNQAPIEKMLVDLFSKKLVGHLIGREEYSHIFEAVFDRYAINESTMLRYAGRRHLEGKIRRFISEETDIQLHM